MTRAGVEALVASAFAASLLVACSGASGPPQVRQTATPNTTPTGIATPSPTPTPVPTPAVTPQFNDWPTYGYDNSRESFNPNSSNFSPASLPSLHLAWQRQLVLNQSQTQPILATNVGGHAGTLVVGGWSGNALGIDALTGTNLWTTALGTATYSCDSSAFTTGVGGTAVYDPGASAFFMVSSTNAGSNLPVSVWINKLDAATGTLVARVNIAPSPLPGEIDFGHTGIALDNGTLYAGVGSNCDVSSWRGRVAAVNESAMTLSATFFTAWNSGPSPAPYSGAGVWAWGGVAVDAAHNVYAGVGNTDTNTGGGGPIAPFTPTLNETAGYGDHMVQLTPGLGSVSQSNVSGLSLGGTSVDLDLSGTPVLFTPMGCSQVLAVGGKSGRDYLYDPEEIDDGPFATEQLGPSVDDSKNIANGAFSPLTGLFYAPVPYGMQPATSGPGLAAIRACNGSATIAWSTAFGADSLASFLPRATPTVTAGGIVFEGTPCERDLSGGCSGTGIYGGALWALDASTGTILNGGKPIVITPYHLRMGPVVDGDWLYLIDQGGDLYGFTLDANYPPIVNRLTTARSLPYIRRRR